MLLIFVENGKYSKNWFILYSKFSGMSENAIAAAESPDNNVSKAASSVEKPEVNKQLTGSTSDSDQENIKKDPGSIKEEDNVDESTK